MALTPQTNCTLEDIAGVVNRFDSFAICGHVSPDGDCVSSQLALYHALSAMGKNVTLLLAKDESIDAKLDFLKDIDKIIPAEKAFEQGVSCDVFIGVDVPTRERIGEFACKILDAAQDSITIDHHQVDTTMANHVYVDADSASASILVWKLLRILMDKPPMDSAICAYTGLVTDTGCFQFQNTDRDAFLAASELVAYGVHAADIAREVMQNTSLASIKIQSLTASRMILLADGQVAITWVTDEDMKKYGAVKTDLDDVVNMLRSVRGVRVACSLREQDGKIRGNLRAKDSTDISVVARELGGGGHKAASGFILECTIEEAVDKLSNRLSKLYD